MPESCEPSNEMETLIKSLERSMTNLKELEPNEGVASLHGVLASLLEYTVTKSKRQEESRNS